ncbi:MAG: hypothetical protein ACR2KJ_11310 [Jatrophihabitans sp.]
MPAISGCFVDGGGLDRRLRLDAVEERLVEGVALEDEGTVLDDEVSAGLDDSEGRPGAAPLVHAAMPKVRAIASVQHLPRAPVLRPGARCAAIRPVSQRWHR